ncbi:MAG: tetratricopeptide repeat protein [Candidatus Omnitrophica bacterium]|nr:tetratricopeptide repeat protein [Candidatus Omnitrophota bacterium]MBU1924070.1 tetratricopeptide repeat protein [Candidatus Omnitrophota bacterium]
MKRIIEFLLLLVVLVIFLFFSRGKLEAFFYNQGNDYFEHSLYKEAIGSYGNALKINPQSWLAHLGLAEAYRENRDYDKAADEYNKALSINHFCVKAYQSLAEMYSQKGSHPEALSVISRARNQIPNNPEIIQASQECCYVFVVSTLNKSTELFLANKNAEAISLLKDTLKSCPDFAVGQYTLGYYYVYAKDYDNAEVSLKKALLIDPQFHYAHKLLSEVYFKKGDFEKELSSAKNALTLNNNDASICNDLALALMHLERYAEAITYLKKAVSLDPDNADYIYSLGSVYRDNKMFNQAISEYNKLRVLKNDYPNLHNDLADIYDNLNNHAQAVLEYQKETQYCQQELKNNPDNSVLLNNYAYALNGLGESEKAKKIIDGVINAHPRYRQAYLTLSKINEKMQNADLALMALEKAKQLSVGEAFIDNEISRLNKQPSPKAETQLEQKDTIYLKNGRQLQGEIKKEYPDKVVLEVWLGSSRGEVVFYRDSIERIDKAQD